MRQHKEDKAMQQSQDMTTLQKKMIGKMERKMSASCVPQREHWEPPNLKNAPAQAQPNQAPPTHDDLGTSERQRSKGASRRIESDYVDMEPDYLELIKDDEPDSQDNRCTDADTTSPRHCEYTEHDPGCFPPIYSNTTLPLSPRTPEDVSDMLGVLRPEGDAKVEPEDNVFDSVRKPQDPDELDPQEDDPPTCIYSNTTLPLSPRTPEDVSDMLGVLRPEGDAEVESEDDVFDSVRKLQDLDDLDPQEDDIYSNTPSPTRRQTEDDKETSRLHPEEDVGIESEDEVFDNETKLQQPEDDSEGSDQVGDNESDTDQVIYSNVPASGPATGPKVPQESCERRTQPVKPPRKQPFGRSQTDPGSSYVSPKTNDFMTDAHVSRPPPPSCGLHTYTNTPDSEPALETDDFMSGVSPQDTAQPPPPSCGHHMYTNTPDSEPASGTNNVSSRPDVAPRQPLLMKSMSYDSGTHRVKVGKAPVPTPRTSTKDRKNSLKDRPSPE